jgi:hypothetical protein
MNKKDLIFISIAIGVIGLFIFLSLIGKKASPMTAANHPQFNSEWTRETCLSCHHPETGTAQKKMPPSHPQKGSVEDRRGTGCTVPGCHRPPESGAKTALIYQPNHLEGQFSWLSRQQK